MSRTFKFRLARVLRVRSISERTARADWAAAEIDAQRAESTVDEALANIDSARRELGALQDAGSLAAGRVLASDQAISQMEAYLRSRRVLSGEARTLAEGQRSEWSERRRDEHALERLEERQREEHRAEVQRVENAENDEWASARARRRQPSLEAPETPNVSATRPSRPM